MRHLICLSLFCIFFTSSPDSYLVAQDLERVDSLTTFLAATNQNLPARQEDSTSVNALNELALEFLYVNPDTTILLAERAAKLAQDAHFTRGEANAYNSGAGGHWVKGDYSKALAFFFLALKKRTQLNDHSGMASTLSNIGNVYFDEGDYPQALNHYFKAFDIAEEIDNKQLMAVWLGNIGSVYRRQGETIKALDYFFESLKIKKEIRVPL